ncbi:hypothetical protein K7X08_001060 [Anisodus acutangulus]|uniref:Uncharacterized protein n=1 Tax=Anisodus acutangulus TaxID=402998 RepID=A0A9Q1MN78_9SOLA|nr:hypothetical protein K7X08_001060 [Anisodus acutangulus]
MEKSSEETKRVEDNQSSTQNKQSNKETLKVGHKESAAKRTEQQSKEMHEIPSDSAALSVVEDNQEGQTDTTISKEKHHQILDKEGKANGKEDNQNRIGEENRLLVASNNAINSQNNKRITKDDFKREVDIEDDNDLKYTAIAVTDEQNKGDASPRQVAKAKKEGRQNKTRDKSVPPKTVGGVLIRKASSQYYYQILFPGTAEAQISTYREATLNSELFR